MGYSYHVLETGTNVAMSAREAETLDGANL